MAEPRGKRVYAIYKGDTFIAEGTADELAEGLGVKRSTIQYWATPAHHRKKGANYKYAVVVEEGYFKRDEVDYERLNQLFKKSGLGRGELADELLIDQRSSNKILRGSRPLSKLDAEVMAFLFGVDVEDFLTEKGKESL